MPTKKVGYNYVEHGRISKITYPDERTVFYTYDLTDNFLKGRMLYRGQINEDENMFINGNFTIMLSFLSAYTVC